MLSKLCAAVQSSGVNLLYFGTYPGISFSDNTQKYLVTSENTSVLPQQADSAAPPVGHHSKRQQRLIKNRFNDMCELFRSYRLVYFRAQLFYTNFWVYRLTQSALVLSMFCQEFYLESRNICGPDAES